MSNKGRKELKAESIMDTLKLPLIANIPFDKRIRKSLYKRVPSSYLYPRAKSSKQYVKLAEHIVNEKI